MLLGEHSGGHEHRHLVTVANRLEGGAHSDLRLPETDVAADHAIHRPRSLHIGLHRLDRRLLVGRLLVREGRFEFALPLVVRGERASVEQLACRVELDQVGRHADDGAAGSGACAAPLRRAEPCQVRWLIGRTDIARDAVEVLDGNVNPVGARVAQLDVVSRLSRDLTTDEPAETGDAVVGVHDEVAR